MHEIYQSAHGSLSFPWGKWRFVIVTLLSNVPFEQQQQLLEEVSCLHKEAEKEIQQQLAKQQFSHRIVCLQKGQKTFPVISSQRTIPKLNTSALWS